MNKELNLKTPWTVYLGFLLSLSSLFILPGLLAMILTLGGASKIKKFPEIYQGLFLARINMILSWLGILSGAFVFMMFMIISPFISGFFQAKIEEQIWQDLRQLESAVKIYRADNNFYPETLEVLKKQKYISITEIKFEDYQYQHTQKDFSIQLKDPLPFTPEKQFKYSSEPGVK
ncbi:MAG: hypothetical protein PHV06_05545 [bacterium]|nr:hypothetical protein [bacterium]